MTLTAVFDIKTLSDNPSPFISTHSFELYVVPSLSLIPELILVLVGLESLTLSDPVELGRLPDIVTPKVLSLLSEPETKVLVKLWLINPPFIEVNCMFPSVTKSG